MPTAIVFLLLCSNAAADALKLSNQYSSLSYRGYRFRRARKHADGPWYVRLDRPSQRSLDFAINSDTTLPNIAEYVSLGLRNLLHSDSRQFVACIWTGGAHCCHYYWIVDISATDRVIFDSRRYDEYELQAVDFVDDLDGDGTEELGFNNSLRGWHVAGFAFWPSPPQIFRFDRNRYVYVPANHVFPQVATQGLPKLMHAIQSWRPGSGLKEEHDGNVLEAALTLIYAGRGTEAEPLVRRHSKLNWHEFRKHLDQDPFYKDLLKEPGFHGVP